MNNKIVTTHTPDGIDLHGFLSEAKDATAIWLHTHGTASNFYEEDFVYTIAEKLNEIGVSVLSFNNRGNGVLQSYPKIHGAASEIFEECLIDFDAWIQFVKEIGYSKIFLSGHSLGTEKVIYYTAKGKYREEIQAITLLAFADSYGVQEKFVRKVNKNLLEEARNLLETGKGYELLTAEWMSHAGVLPKNANSYLNFFSPGSELSKALPLRLRKLEIFKQLPLPILAVVGDLDHYTILTPSDALKLLKFENPKVETNLMKDCDHDFIGCEEELAIVVRSFILKNI